LQRIFGGKIRFVTRGGPMMIFPENAPSSSNAASEHPSLGLARPEGGAAER
jgi:hypothetical protein